MRPAQLALAEALRPARPPAARMHQATVVVPGGVLTTTGLITPGPKYTDSFNRADGPLGSTDGGSGDPTPWAATNSAFGIRGGAAGLVPPLTSGYGNNYAYINCGSLGGTYEVTTVRAPTNEVNAAWGLAIRVNSSPAILYAASAGQRLGDDGAYHLVPPTYKGIGPGAASMGAWPSPVAQAGDRLKIIDAPGSLSMLVNGVHLAGSPATAAHSNNWLLDAQGYLAGLWEDQAPDVPAQTGLLTDFSYTPLPYTGTTSTVGDTVVDFGDGVHVACPRGASCPPLVVGDQVLVLRQHHSLVVVDKIIPLGGT